MDAEEYHALRAVEDTHWWFRSLHEHVLKCLRTFCPPPRPLHIFDAGCGTGGLAAALQALGTVEGIDSSPLAIEHCRARGLTGMRIGDLNTFSFPQETYDAIVSIDVLYHRDIGDPRSVQQSFLRGLKPGGILFLHLPAYEMLRSDHDRRVHTGRRFRLRAVKRLLSETGFAIEHSSYRLTLLFFPALLIRLLQRLFNNASERNVSAPSALKRSFFGNSLLLALHRAENAVSRYVPLPCGISLYVVARKPQSS